MKINYRQQINYNSINFLDWKFSFFCSDKGLIFTTFKNDPISEFSKWSGISEAVKKENIEINAAFLDYFSGKNNNPSVSIDWDFWRFSNFQILVLKKLIGITKPVSYSEFANQIGNQKAVRPVATAVGKNPFEIVVPCHRIITKSGEIGQYRDGSNIKRALLQLERQL
ncbi:MGMT family protein [Oenococcus sp. UCMA 16435]|nr:MGMT family protein [Oenococcus sp. UCMA 16435]MDI4584198.1 methylated-DNA--[protein]-cysteine S-methyltransferase [Oenococcus sp. UCMA 14587]